MEDIMTRIHDLNSDVERSLFQRAHSSTIARGSSRMPAQCIFQMWLWLFQVKTSHRNHSPVSSMLFCNKFDFSREEGLLKHKKQMLFKDFDK